MKNIVLITLLYLLAFSPTKSIAQLRADTDPEAFFSISNSGLCEGDSVFFINESKTIAGNSINTVHWYFGDGSDSRVEHPIHKYNSTGSVTVSLVAFTNTNGIIETDSTSQTITINPSPTISFSYLGGGTNFTNDTSFLEGGTLTISVIENYPVYLWAPSASTSQSITVNESGSYLAIVVDANGCSNQKQQIITVSPLAGGDSASIQIGNDILTPNGDGINDLFKIIDLDKYAFEVEISIYNLWGDIIYHSTDYQNDWDGTYNSNLLDAGTYYYIIRSKNRKGNMGYIDILK